MLEVAPPVAPPPLEQSLYEVFVDAAQTRLSWVVARVENRLLFRWVDQADFWLDGRRVTITPVPGADMAAVEQGAVDLVLPRVLHRLGRPCLHAAAVRLPGREQAAIFLAPSGSGKSTLAASVAQRGGALLADDAVAPWRRDDGVVVVPPAYPSLRLWADSAKALYGEASRFPIAPRRQKRRVTGDLAEAAPLAAMFFLEPDRSCRTAPPRCARLPASESLARLVEYVLRLTHDDPSSQAAEFDILAAAAAQAPMFRLRFPHRFAALDEVMAAVEAVL
ncbi:MAG: hypothetical protein AAF928_06270 [Myxococcota bacterium]